MLRKSHFSFWQNEQDGQDECSPVSSSIPEEQVMAATFRVDPSASVVPFRGLLTTVVSPKLTDGGLQ